LTTDSQNSNPEKQDNTPNIKHDMFLGAYPDLFWFAKRLRNHETKAEKILWSRLSNKQLGVKFRRQHPIHSYVADFYCHSHKLIIEVDGPIHDSVEHKLYDEKRTDMLG
jgi:cyclase